MLTLEELEERYPIDSIVTIQNDGTTWRVIGHELGLPLIAGGKDNPVIIGEGTKRSRGGTGHIYPWEIEGDDSIAVAMAQLGDIIYL